VAAPDSLDRELVNCHNSFLWRASESAQPGGLIRGKKIKQWVFYQRDEARIAEAKELLNGDW
jgi:hypothetical protein